MKIVGKEIFKEFKAYEEVPEVLDKLTKINLDYDGLVIAEVENHRGEIDMRPCIKLHFNPPTIPDNRVWYLLYESKFTPGEPDRNKGYPYLVIRRLQFEN